MLLTCLRRMVRVTAFTVLAATEVTEHTKRWSTQLPQATKDEERLLGGLGDLGDPDGLYSFHQQEMANARNVAERLGAFWSALERNGISELARIELVKDYYEHLRNMEELDASIQSPSFLDWEDEDD